MIQDAARKCRACWSGGEPLHGLIVGLRTILGEVVGHRIADKDTEVVTTTCALTFYLSSPEVVWFA